MPVPLTRCGTAPDLGVMPKGVGYADLGRYFAFAYVTCIDMMMRHTSKDVSERIYTHKMLEELAEALSLTR